MDKAPTIRSINQTTGLVQDTSNPAYKNMNNALVLKVGGEDRVILFIAGSVVERATCLMASLLEQAGIAFDRAAEPDKLRVVSATMTAWCRVTRYTPWVIKLFRHKGLQTFFERGIKARIKAAHATKMARLLARLDQSKEPHDMNLPGWGLHPLHGQLKDHWAVSVNGNWRLTFAFEDADAVLVDYQDYH